MIDASKIISGHPNDVKHGNFVDLIGMKFNKLRIVEFLGFYPRGKSAVSVWKCICDCGKESIGLGFRIKSGTKKSCGCLLGVWLKGRKGMPIHPNALAAVTTHNESKGKNQTPEYKAWLSMKGRCLYKGTKSYERYGGRGIKVCERWLHSFENFLADMGRKPTKEHSIGRIENDGNYEPGNCKWSTKEEQQSNTCVSRLIAYKGKTQTIAQWARESGIKKITLYQRFNRGWTTEKCLNEPIQKH